MRLLSPAFFLLALAALAAAASAYAQNRSDANATSTSPTSKEGNSTEAVVPVTIDDYIRAETDETFKRSDMQKREREKRAKRERENWGDADRVQIIDEPSMARSAPPFQSRLELSLCPLTPSLPLSFS